jgi:hypothetical protein
MQVRGHSTEAVYPIIAANAVPIFCNGRSDLVRTQVGRRLYGWLPLMLMVGVMWTPVRLGGRIIRKCFMLLFGHPAPSIQFNVATDAIGGMEGLGLALRFLKLDSDKVSRRSAPSGPDGYISLHVEKGLLSIYVSRLVESRRMAQSHLRRSRSRRRRPSWSSRTPSASTPTPVSQSAGLSIRYAASANRLPPRHLRSGYLQVWWARSS